LEEFSFLILTKIGNQALISVKKQTSLLKKPDFGGILGNLSHSGFPRDSEKQFSV